jgi:ABC-type nitrate/sulfonate/bicarbonate transport system ATPase subunit
VISLDGLTFAYPHRPTVFSRFSWKVQAGEVWSVLGPSGCGKSTLLLLIAGLLHPQRGSVAVAGEPLARPRPGSSLILQEYGLLPWASVRDNAALGLQIQRFYGPDGRHAPLGTQIARQAIARRVDYWLERLDISDIAEQFPGQVSGGQRQRAAIARALILEPDLLLMDEPFSALDAPTRENLQLLALQLAAEASLTVLLVTHSIEEAAFVGQNVLLLSTPPNTRAEVIPNPHLPDRAYRHSTGYQAVCADLRQRLGSDDAT